MSGVNRMKAVFLPGNKRVEIRAVEVPTPGPGEVLVAVKAQSLPEVAQPQFTVLPQVRGR